MDSKIKNQENAILDIIQKYGDTINLKTSPYLIGEIIRNYSSHFVEREGFPIGADSPPGGTPPPGTVRMPDFRMPIEIQEELSRLTKSLQQLHEKVDALNR